jgi:hypothetical protein
MLAANDRAILEYLRDAEHDVLPVTFVGLVSGRLSTPGERVPGPGCSRPGLLRLARSGYIVRHHGIVQITAAGLAALRQGKG